MGRLFGTDGIRGVANKYPMTEEMAVAVGRAAAIFFARTNEAKPTTILLGKDTRESGDMLENALCTGIRAMGADAHLAGVFPTPGIAFLTASRGANAGIVISASHNPYTDNGIKFFNKHGYKLSVSQEDELETIIFSQSELSSSTGQGKKSGGVYQIKDGEALYADFLKKKWSPISDMSWLKGLKLVVDCANGATGRMADKVFPGAIVLFADPDGKNINSCCGSEHPEAVCRQVVNQGASAGFAFDGDGDRVIAVDELGNIVSGDRIIAICAGHFKQKAFLRNNTVVSTVMSNVGLSRFLRQQDINHITTDVGDRHVIEKMLACDAVIGGEDSGHIIFSDYQTTGDGMLTALMVCEVMAQTRKPLSELASWMTVYPQEMINVEVSQKPDLNTLETVQKAISTAESSLGESGRVLVRYSGTQPMCRVMVEAESSLAARKAAAHIADAIRSQIGL